MAGNISPAEEAQLMQTIEMFEVISQSQSADYQSLEILKEAYLKLNRQKDVINTSKRIAQAYMQLGQLSSAILEYETILQRYPDDPDVLAAIAEIESKANAITAGPVEGEAAAVASGGTGSSQSKKSAETRKQVSAEELDDGKAAMQKIFVEGRLISEADFNLYWPQPPVGEAPGRTFEPLVHMLAEKTLLPVEKSLKVLTEKSRLGYLPLERYDIDLELARSFPKDVCQRWCVLPFDRMSKSVFVATLNPYNKEAAEELQAATQYRIIWYITPPNDLIKGIKKVFR